MPVLAQPRGPTMAQGDALASADNLRALYVTRTEAGALLLAAQRLARLHPALAVPLPLVGAVVGVRGSGGDLAALARVTAVPAVVMTKQDKIDPEATLLVLQPHRGEAAVPLSRLWPSNAAGTPAEQWATAARAYQQAAVAEAGAGGALLGSRAAVTLAAWRLMQLALLSPLLTRLDAMLKNQTAAKAPGDGSEDDALMQLLHAICTLRAMPPDAARLREFAAQLQGPEELVAAWRRQQEGERERRRQQGAVELERRRRQQRAEALERAQRQQAEHQEAERQQQAVQREQQLRGGGGGGGGDGGGEAGVRSERQRDGSSAPLTQPRRRRSRSRSRGRSGGRGRSRSSSSDSGRGRELFAPDGLMDLWVENRVGASKHAPAECVKLPPGDVPREAGTSRQRDDWVELLLALGVIWARSCVGYKLPGGGSRGPAAFAPGDRVWAEQLVDAERPRSRGEGGPLEAAAVAAFISRRRGALRRLRDAPGFAALDPDWRAHLVAHSLFRAEVAALTAALVRAAGRSGGAVDLGRIKTLSSQPLNLYRLLWLSDADFVAASIPQSQLVVTAGRRQQIMSPAEAARRGEGLHQPVFVCDYGRDGLNLLEAGPGAAGASTLPAAAPAPRQQQGRGRSGEREAVSDGGDDGREAKRRRHEGEGAREAAGGELAASAVAAGDSCGAKGAGSGLDDACTAPPLLPPPLVQGAPAPAAASRGSGGGGGGGSGLLLQPLVVGWRQIKLVAPSALPKPKPNFAPRVASPKAAAAVAGPAVQQQPAAEAEPDQLAGGDRRAAPAAAGGVQQQQSGQGGSSGGGGRARGRAEVAPLPAADGSVDMFADCD